MKIGIVTRHDALNAGAILQAYALQTCLEGMEHQVEFIDIESQYKFNWRNYIAKSPKAMWYKWIDNFNLLRYRRQKDWNQCLHKSPFHYHTYEQLKKNPPLYDIYIVGSDQVWNFLRELNPLYLLEFAPKGKKRIAYAASMGQCVIPNKLHDGLKKMLEQFNAVSIREDNGVAFVNELMGSKFACKTLDPTLLINQKDYNGICVSPQIKKAFIASYILSHLDRQQCVNLVKWAKLQRKVLINLRNPATCIQLLSTKNMIVTPYQWLGYMREAEIIISGSFHATVFALIYHKPFVVLLPKMQKEHGGNARINSLLAPLGLQYRIIYDNDIETMNSIFSKKINWNYVDASIHEQRQQSIQFLNTNIL
mgnify:CR=1 FL=1